MTQVIKYVSLKKPTYERLKSHGKMGDTFNDVVERILDENENKPKTNAPRL